VRQRENSSTPTLVMLKNYECLVIIPEVKFEGFSQCCNGLKQETVAANDMQITVMRRNEDAGVHLPVTKK
jgi:PHD/YefM family antitoxin component YafN of YafNO toxin-antitoxin module